MRNPAVKPLYGLAYRWALEKDATLPHDEITRQANVIIDYLGFVWEHREGKDSKKSARTPAP